MSCSSRWIVNSSCPFEDGLVSNCSGNCDNCEYDGRDDLKEYLKEENEYE